MEKVKSQAFSDWRQWQRLYSLIFSGIPANLLTNTSYVDIADTRGNPYVTAAQRQSDLKYAIKLITRMLNSNTA